SLVECFLQLYCCTVVLVACDNRLPNTFSGQIGRIKQMSSSVCCLVATNTKDKRRPHFDGCHISIGGFAGTTLVAG
ncbi:uncharacterized protein GGS25DRAFT_502039, partial [Hypoxylon fragiforme]|uniref:uncharacterized protein n=1 Tax=Hypoxylon fragiforme TaxID=63214 RepID=UPI0020C69E08